MTKCKECGRESQAADNGREMETHWLGCSRRLAAHARNLIEASAPTPKPVPKRRGRPPKKENGNG